MKDHQKHPIVRQPLLTAVLDPSKTSSRVEIKRIDFQPGQQTGLHFHRCPVLGYVAKGTVLFEVEGQAARTLQAGDAFFEPAGKKILHFDNASATEPMTFICFYLL